MKNLVLSSMLLLFSTVCISQADLQRKWGLAFSLNSIQSQIEVPIAATGGAGMAIDANGNFTDSGDKTDNSLSCSIVPKYFLNNDVCLRFEFGITNLNMKNHYDSRQTSNPRNIHDESFQEKIYRYLPGIQWFFFKKKVVESFCSLNLCYIKYGSSIYNSYNEYRDQTTDTVQYWGNSNEKMQSGVAGGLCVSTGCNFYLKKHISFGVEISSAMLYYKTGGQINDVRSGQVIPNPIITVSDTYTDSFKGLRLSKLMSSFNVSLWL
ncbi:MAG TPA: DUF3575 domain-containing protein [Bacteroidia bacterium]|jgi:hypothetical protein|nr:DUF3575 domain-containing protein [Bacteroidia bacterium]